MNLQHGHDWTGQDLSGWWASEKMDGWRSAWNGTELLTRTGNPYTAPEWFTRDLPKDTMLDCELWLGRGFGCNDVHRAISAGEWHRLKLVAFDVPHVGMTIEAALPLLKSLKLPAHVTVVKYRRVESTDHALQIMGEIVNAHGEGCVSRQPLSAYREGRTPHLLKLKPSCLEYADSLYAINAQESAL